MVFLVLFLDFLMADSSANTTSVKIRPKNSSHPENDYLAAKGETIVLSPEEGLNSSWMLEPHPVQNGQGAVYTIHSTFMKDYVLSPNGTELVLKKHTGQPDNWEIVKTETSGAPFYKIKKGEDLCLAFHNENYHMETCVKDDVSQMFDVLTTEKTPVSGVNPENTTKPPTSGENTQQHLTTTAPPVVAPEKETTKTQETTAEAPPLPHFETTKTEPKEVATKTTTQGGDKSSEQGGIIKTVTEGGPSTALEGGDTSLHPQTNVVPEFKEQVVTSTHTETVDRTVVTNNITKTYSEIITSVITKTITFSVFETSTTTITVVSQKEPTKSQGVDDCVEEAMKEICSSIQSPEKREPNPSVKEPAHEKEKEDSIKDKPTIKDAHKDSPEGSLKDKHPLSSLEEICDEEKSSLGKTEKPKKKKKSNMFKDAIDNVSKVVNNGKPLSGSICEESSSSSDSEDECSTTNVHSESNDDVTNFDAMSDILCNIQKLELNDNKDIIGDGINLPDMFKPKMIVKKKKKITTKKPKVIEKKQEQQPPQPQQPQQPQQGNQQTPAVYYPQTYPQQMYIPGIQNLQYQNYQPPQGQQIQKLICRPIVPGC